MPKRQPDEGQPSLFDPRPPRSADTARPPVEAPRPKSAKAPAARRWTMPVVEGQTVAEIRVRWSKRLTPGQVAQVESEISALPQRLSKLGFGSVQVERAFVRRRKG